MKLKIGFFSFTCCEGCVIVFTELLNTKFNDYMKKIDIINTRILQKVDVEKTKKMHIAFVEGAISTNSEIKKLKLIRSKTKKLVALGSGAVSGYPSNQRNKFDAKKKKEIKPLIEKLKQIPEIQPVEKFVKVDDKIDGCPVDETELEKKINSYLKLNKRES